MSKPMITKLAPPAMITLRAKAGTQGLAEAVKAACGCALPAPRQITEMGEARCAWMSPDEYLLIVAAAERGTAIAALEAGLSGQHYLVADVSDARVFYDISGEGAAQVLQRLSPADIESLAQGEIRRSRLAQVAGAFWAEGQGYRVVAFRSVDGYVNALLQNAAHSVATAQ